MYSSTLPSTSALEGVGGHRHAPAASPRERPSSHCIGGWVGPGVGLDGRKISPPPGFDLRIVQHVASRYTDCAIPVRMKQKPFTILSR